MTKKQRKNLIRIISCLAVFLVVFIMDLCIHLDKVIPNEKIAWILPFSLYFAIYLWIGYDVLWKAIRNIAKGQVFDENFLMCFATIGAFGIQEFAEGVAVLLFYQVGEWFQNYAVGKSRKSISELMDIRPDYANLIKEDGEIEMVDPSEINIHDHILVKPGEKIPLDGKIIKGSSTLDTKALTGESLPQEVSEGVSVMSGTINLTGTIEIDVEKVYFESTVSKILDLVENAASEKSEAENFITKFAKWYTPIVVISAVLLAVIPGIITNNWSEWIARALNFLVVSCPCALVISIPLSFFAGIGGASKHGILIKGSSYLEQFQKASIFVFDKTGTLTKGNFAITRIVPENRKDEILRLAYIAERNSNHPIAESIRNLYDGVEDSKFTMENISGKGIVAKNENETIYCGNEKLMQAFEIPYEELNEVGTVVYVARNLEYIGAIVIADEIKDNAKDMIQYLNSQNIKTIMLTGDNEKIASHIAKQLGITEYKSSLLPQDKVEEVKLLLEKKLSKDVLCFVGDGINDAPVLMSSDIGISMGGVGSDAAIEASDIVLMHDDLLSIKKAKMISDKTMKIVRENIAFALGVKILILVLSAFGITNMWFAIFGDVGVAILAILNAMRTSSIKEK